MSDCPKCWDNPCECGWEYRHWPRERRERMAAVVMGVEVGILQAAIRAPEKHPRDEREEKTFDQFISEHGTAVEREYQQIHDEYGDAAPLLSHFKQQRYEEWLRGEWPRPY
jgi:hypothetical protein